METSPAAIQEPCVLDAIELRAWQGFIYAHGAMLRDLDALLRSTANLSLGGFAVLDQLRDQRDAGLRLTDLAERTQITISGISRIVTTLEEQEYLHRLPDPHDGRASRIALTAQGAHCLETAQPEANRFVRERFVDHFTAGELATMAEFWDRLTT